MKNHELCLRQEEPSLYRAPFSLGIEWCTEPEGWHPLGHPVAPFLVPASLSPMFFLSALTIFQCLSVVA